MIQLELNDEEQVILAEVLKTHLSNLSFEIADTDTKSFRDQLKARRDVLEKIRSALAGD
jgi:hypothetical protein